MKKLVSFYWALFLCLGISHAQNTGVLKQKLLEASTDSAKVMLMTKLGFEYAFIDLDTARQYCLEAIELAKKTEFIRGEADGLNNLAISYDIEGNHEVAVVHFLEALDLYEQIEEVGGRARIYNNCGMVYQSLGDIPKSLQYHNKSLALEKQLADSVGIAYSMSQIAALHLQEDNYDSALHYYALAQTILEIFKDDTGLSYVHWGLGELYLYTKDFEKALAHSEQAYALFESEENKKGMAETLQIMGKTYLRMGELKQAELKLLSALEMSENLEAKNVILECLLDLFRLHKTKNQYDKALEYHERYSILKDDILKSEMTSNIKEIESKYQFEKQEQKIELLNRENEFQTLLRNIFVGVAIVIAILLIFLYRAYKVLKLKNEEIEQKNIFIEIERKNALAAVKAKSDFLSVMSHEIRTPMNIVMGYTYWLLENEPREDQRESLEFMKISADNLLSLLNDILDLSKLEFGKLEFESIPFDIKHLFRNLCAGYDGEVKKKRLQFSLKIDKNVPSKLIGDPGRLSQVVNNLISNSIKFTEVGTVELHVSLVEKGLKVARLRFNLEDTGIGISEEKLQQIFENFVQADSGTSRKYGGTGLGLSITRGILEHFDSDISVESQLGIGSVFSFELSLKLDLGQNN